MTGPPPGGSPEYPLAGEERGVGWLREALAPRYDVEKEIGRGGMATVFLARDTQHDRPVAIKVLQSPETPGGADRFLREVRVTAALSHPHILPLLDSGSADGTLYYVMPYVAGDTLGERLTREGPLPVAEVVRLTEEIADALDTAHRHGVIHRDIKPGNILLEEGHAVVADFGLVRALHPDADTAMTGTGVALGTPAYMSPEQASGQGIVDGRSDIYSLGCVVYEMLAGEPPFTAPSAQALLAKKLSLPVVPISTFRDAVPQSVDQVLKTALARLPADRYQTAGAFASALAESARSQDGVGTGSLRRAAAVALLALAAVTAGVAGWVLLSPRGLELDEGKVVVFPLEDGHGGTQDGLLVSQLIQGVLEHAGTLKLIDGWSRLDPGQRVDIATLGPEAERDLAVAQGARYYIAGRLIPRGDSLHVFLRVHDAQGDSLVAQGTGAGRSDSPIQVGFETLTGLLPAWLDPGREVDLSPVRDRDPGAVVDWIRGEREYRLGRFSEARDLFQSAVDADTLFAFAALKGAQAAQWELDAEGSMAFAEHAIARIQDLPPKHRLLARGLYAYWVGQADSSVAALRAAIEMDPDWQEAWTALGQTYFHLLPSDVTDGAMAREALERAWRLDPDFNPPLINLADMALGRGDVELGSRLVDILARARPNESAIAHLGLMRDCVLGRMGMAEWRQAVALDPGVALSAAKRLSEGAGQLRCAEEGFLAIWEGEGVPNAHRWGGALGLQAVYLAGSRHAAAAAVLDSAMAWVGGAVGPYMVVAVAGGAPMEALVEKWIRTVTEQHGPAFETAGHRTRWAVGAWYALRQHDTLGLSGVEASSRVAAMGGGEGDRLALAALTAHGAAVRGRGAEALRILESLRPAVPQYDLVWESLYSLPLERLLRVRLLLEQGRPAEALRVAGTFDHPAPIENLALLQESLRLRREAALAMDSVSLADRYSARLDALQGAAAR